MVDMVELRLLNCRVWEYTDIRDGAMELGEKMKTVEEELVRRIKALDESMVFQVVGQLVFVTGDKLTVVKALDD